MCQIYRRYIKAMFMLQAKIAQNWCPSFVTQIMVFFHYSVHRKYYSGSNDFSFWFGPHSYVVLQFCLQILDYVLDECLYKCKMGNRIQARYATQLQSEQSVSESVQLISVQLNLFCSDWVNNAHNSFLTLKIRLPLRIVKNHKRKAWYIA